MEASKIALGKRTFYQVENSGARSSWTALAGKAVPVDLPKLIEKVWLAHLADATLERPKPKA
jgi:hypothetical protein